MFVRWNLTVCSATQSSLPIASFESPRASAVRIAVSRSVRPAARAALSLCSGIPIALKTLPSIAWRRAAGRSIGLADDSSASAAKAAGLTTRELAILTALAQGKSNAAIAKELWVAPQTVKFHLTNIYRKLNVANRTEAARYAYQQGLVESPLYEGDGE